MRLSHRSLSVGLLLTIFFIILIGKIDEKSTWNWFVVFTPIWVLDVVYLSLIYAKKRSDIYYNNNFNQIVVYSIFLKVLFQILICIKLEFAKSLPIYLIMFPLWCLLSTLSFHLLKLFMSSE